jgi:hypothetical protein
MAPTIRWRVEGIWSKRLLLDYRDGAGCQYLIRKCAQYPTGNVHISPLCRSLLHVDNGCAWPVVLELLIERNGEFTWTTVGSNGKRYN